MASQTPPDPDNLRPIRRESTLSKITKTARTLTIGSSHAAEEVPEEKVKQASCSAYLLRWEEKLKPFLQKRYPDLKAKYDTKHLRDDRFWFAVPDHLTEDDIEALKMEIWGLRDQKPKAEKRPDSPERRRGGQ